MTRYVTSLYCLNLPFLRLFRKDVLHGISHERTLTAVQMPTCEIEGQDELKRISPPVLPELGRNAQLYAGLVPVAPIQNLAVVNPYRLLQAKNRQMEIDAAEIRIRAERKIGLLMQEQREAGLMAKPPGHNQYVDRVADRPEAPTLSDAGIDKHLADRARKTAAIPDDEFEEIVDDWRGRIAVENERVTVNIMDAAERHAKAPHVANNTGNNEWYTPVEYIELARHVMGDITLDPASSEIANRTVKATHFFTAQDNGLEKEWFGNVWMNPPYAQPLINQFADKLAEEFKRGAVHNAIVLVCYPLAPARVGHTKLSVYR